MSDELEQPAEMPDSAAADNAGGEGQHQAGAHDANPFDDADSQEQPDEEENEEVEVGERKISLPKTVAERLKSERMMHADYTQKTQSVAEERKAMQVERETMQRQSTAYVQDVAKVIAIDDQLAQYARVDWPLLMDEDPVTAMKYQHAQTQLQNQRAQAVNELTQKQQHTALEEQQGIAKQAQDASGYFAREIKGWSEERNTTLQKYATAEGIDMSVLGKALLQSPAIVKLVNKAEMYDQLVKKQSPKQAPAAAAKPAIKIGSGGASAVTDPAKMTDAQFAAMRRKQIQSRK